MTDLDKQIEEETVTIFKLGMLDALGSKGKPNPIPALKEAVENIKQAFKDAGAGPRKVRLRVKTRLWTPKGFDEYDHTWTPQVIKARNKFHKSLDARGRSFVEVEFTNEGDDLMSGQEWYDRFDKEARILLGNDMFDEPNQMDITPDDLTSIAKKAAGIE